MGAETVQNFVKTCQLRVRLSPALAASFTDAGATVCLTAGGGGCSFQFDMLPSQARELAAILVRMANEIEPESDDLAALTRATRAISAVALERQA